ncbi:MAG: hypothetical protein AMXMBFR34_25420 [Myxococcaceae bacterium]
MNAPLPMPRRRAARRSREVLADGRHLVEGWLRRSCDGGLVDLRGQVRALPLLVRCAVRVHDGREPGGARVLGLSLTGTSGLTERWSVVVAAAQRVVLLFGSRGALEAAGHLVVAAPEAHGPAARWTRVEWAADPGARDWY